jgi:hypothetical protein
MIENLFTQKSSASPRQARFSWAAVAGAALML